MPSLMWLRPDSARSVGFTCDEPHEVVERYAFQLLGRSRYFVQSLQKAPRACVVRRCKYPEDRPQKRHGLGRCVHLSSAMIHKGKRRHLYFSPGITMSANFSRPQNRGLQSTHRWKTRKKNQAQQTNDRHAWRPRPKLMRFLFESNITCW